MDIWAEVKRPFSELKTLVGRALASDEAELGLCEVLEKNEIPWLDITKRFRREATFPENVIELALTADFLNHMVRAILADGSVELQEMETAYTLAKPLAQSLSSLERFRQFRTIELDSVGVFLNKFAEDSHWFGGPTAKETALLGFWLCAYASIVHGDHSPNLKYEFITETIVKAIFDGEPRNSEEQSLYESLQSFLTSARRQLEQASRPRSKQRSASQSPVSGSNAAMGKAFTKALAHPDEPTGNPQQPTPEEILQEALAELDALIGLDGVKTEVKRLTSFLKVQQQRRSHGLRESTQTLHFVFTGNPGTGKTTVARIVGKILYGFQLLDSFNVIECDRASLVGGYLGQTAIKTNEKIDSAIGGVLFIDEAYTLAGDALTYGHGDMYGDEAINTLLKRMEDDRDQLVVIAAGYPKPMERFIRSNPGLESRFTRYIHFDDYTVADLCRIFEAFCRNAEYVLSPTGRAWASLLLTIAYNQRDDRFGNARFIRNVFERATSLHSERLFDTLHEDVTKEMLTTLDGDDIPFEFVREVSRESIDITRALWSCECPSCGASSRGPVKYLGRQVTCKKCNQSFLFAWWSPVPESIAGVESSLTMVHGNRRGIKVDDRRSQAARPQPETKPDASTTLPIYDGWIDDARRGEALLEEGIGHLERMNAKGAIKCFEAAIRIDWDGSNPSNQPYFLMRAKAYEMDGRTDLLEALSEYNSAMKSWEMGHYRESVKQFNHSMSLDPEFAWAPNNLAWRYATSPHAKLRNPDEAIRLATLACRLSNWHCWSFIDTLSTGYAEGGDFSKAIYFCELALRMAPVSAREGVLESLAMFRAGEPLRDHD